MKQKDKDFTLRPATVDDIDFIFDLRVKTMKPLFEVAFGWDENEERKKAADELKNAEIVMIDKKKVGVIKVIPRTNEFHLDQMQILPEHQQCGIGAELIRMVIKRSEISDQPITLMVMKDTPAKRLYEHFDFLVINDFEHNCRMCRQPS